MLDGAPNKVLLMIGGSFAIGWVVAKIGSFLSRRRKAKRRDPRDDRIRSQEAELRIAKTSSEQNKTRIEALKKELSETQVSLEESKAAFKEQAGLMVRLRRDLKESVKKTRELRGELTERATEGVRSEVKLREIETELEVSRASTDLIATGVLDYSVSPDDDDDDDDAHIVKAVT